MDWFLDEGNSYWIQIRTAIFSCHAEGIRTGPPVDSNSGASSPHREQMAGYADKKLRIVTNDDKYELFIVNL
jgi:hypothetical protein